MITVLLLIIVGIAIFIPSRHKDSSNSMYKVDVPNNPELTSLAAPYSKISDIEGVGPYSSNQEAVGYLHNGIDFMSNSDLVEYRAISGGVVAEAKVFYDSSRGDTHPQVNVVVLYNNTTKIVYSFEPFSKNIADAERQMTLMNVKEGDTIVAGQLLGKLIKTAPQSHVHIHVMKDEKTFCFANLFSENDSKDMLTKALVPPNKPTKLCYE